MPKSTGNPTQEKLDLAKKLGIDFVGKTRDQLQEEIDQVDRELGELALARPALRLNNHIVHRGAIFVVTAVRREKRSVSIRRVDSYRTRPMRASLLLDAEELDPELAKRLPSQPSTNQFDLLFPNHDTTQVARVDEPQPKTDPPPTLLDAILELTAVLRRIEAKLD